MEHPRPLKVCTIVCITYDALTGARVIRVKNPYSDESHFCRHIFLKFTTGFKCQNRILLFLDIYLNVKNFNMILFLERLFLNLYQILTA